jgi:DNA-3-methyladenine glycosylase I
MIRVVFLAGLSWGMIDKKWPNFKKAFKNFSIAEVAKFDEKDVQRLMVDASIVRNRAKIVATISNAKQLQTIRKEHRSFQSYLDKLDKSENYASAIKELGRRFSRLGPSSARIFLYSVGEKIGRSLE